MFFLFFFNRYLGLLHPTVNLYQLFTVDNDQVRETASRGLDHFTTVVLIRDHYIEVHSSWHLPFARPSYALSLYSHSCGNLVKTDLIVTSTQYGLWACQCLIPFVLHRQISLTESFISLSLAFSALRGFALTGKNWPFAVCIFVLGLVPGAGTELVSSLY